MIESSVLAKDPGAASDSFFSSRTRLVWKAETRPVTRGAAERRAPVEALRMLRDSILMVDV